VIDLLLAPNGGTAPTSVVAFSLSSPDVILDRGTWAMERRERGRVAAESGREDMMAAPTKYQTITRALSCEGRGVGELR